MNPFTSYIFDEWFVSGSDSSGGLKFLIKSIDWLEMNIIFLLDVKGFLFVIYINILHLPSVLSLNIRYLLVYEIIITLCEKKVYLPRGNHLTYFIRTLLLFYEYAIIAMVTSI